MVKNQIISSFLSLQSFLPKQALLYSSYFWSRSEFGRSKKYGQKATYLFTVESTFLPPKLILFLVRVFGQKASYFTVSRLASLAINRLLWARCAHQMSFLDADVHTFRPVTKILLPQETLVRAVKNV